MLRCCWFENVYVQTGLRAKVVNPEWNEYFSIPALSTFSSVKISVFSPKKGKTDPVLVGVKEVSLVEILHAESHTRMSVANKELGPSESANVYWLRLRKANSKKFSDCEIQLLLKFKEDLSATFRPHDIVSKKMPFEIARFRRNGDRIYRVIHIGFNLFSAYRDLFMEAPFRSLFFF